MNRRVPGRDDRIDFPLDEVGGERIDGPRLSLAEPGLGDEVFPVDIAKVAQALLEFPRVPIGNWWRATLPEPTDSVDLRRRLCNRDTGRTQEDKYDRDDT